MKHKTPYDLHSTAIQIVDPGDAGTISVDKNLGVVQLVSAGTETRTLDRPTKPGVRLALFMKTDGGDITLTVTGNYNEAGDSTFVFDDVGEFAEFISLYDGTDYFWRLTSSHSTGNLSQTESAFLEGVTAGAVANSKALVLGSDGTLTVSANTNSPLVIDDGTTNIIDVDTRNTVKDVAGVTISSPATTIATETAVHSNPSLQIPAKTITYTGTTQTTYQKGAQLHVGALTLTDASVATLDAASAVHIEAIAAAGGSLTITASYMISTSVADCFLTNAGVWTDTSCFASGKDGILGAAKESIEAIIGKLVPKSWQYKKEVHGDDFGRQRVGVVYDELPAELRAPGKETAVSAGLLSSFALAAIKILWEQNAELQARLDRLEAA